MDKKALKSIRIQPAACVVKQAKEDKYENRICMGWGRHEIKSYATSEYFQADQVDGLLVISVFRRADLAAGKMEPRITTFIDPVHEQYMSRVGKELNKTGWTGAMLYNITSRLPRACKEDPQEKGRYYGFDQQHRKRLAAWNFREKAEGQKGEKTAEIRRRPCPL